MNEKKYLKWYNKVGYGSGDIAGNVVYALLSAFVMIYLTDTAGLNAGVIGTLMMVARIFDGASDIFFGALIDKTRTRMGRARPWMLWAFFGCAALIIAIFAIPTTLGDNAKYAWFFITYTLLNAGFFTANNIAYSTLTALITKNSAERVQMGSIRFIFAFSTSLLIQTVTVEGVELFGGGEQGWRAIAIIYAVIGLAANTLSVMSVRELPDDELEDRPETEADRETGSRDGGSDEDRDEARDKAEGADDADKLSARESARLLLGNRYYLIILVVFVLTQVFTATLNMGIYFMTYILKDANLLGPFAWAINVPLIAGLVLTPAIVSRFGRMQSVTTTGYAIAVAGRLGGGGRRLPGQRPAHARLHGPGLHRHEPVAGHAQRPHRRGLGVHLSAQRQAHRRDHVLLHVTGSEGRRGRGDGHGGLATGLQRVRRQCRCAAGLDDLHALLHVPVDSRDRQRGHPPAAVAARRGEGQRAPARRTRRRGRQRGRQPSRRCSGRRSRWLSGRRSRRRSRPGLSSPRRRD